MTEQTDQLPPNAPDIERAALLCVIDAACVDKTQAEADQQLQKLKPHHFYDLRHRYFHHELVLMRMHDHALVPDIVINWLKTHKRFEDCGGEQYAINDMLGNLPGTMHLFFPDYLKTLDALATRRWMLAQSHRLKEQAETGDIDLGNLRSELSEALERVDKTKDRETPLLEIITIAEAKAYVPEPKTFLVGADMISLSELTVIAGLPGLGKSRLANTLAFAGARGHGEWMGYSVRRQWKTLILQSENSMRRIQSEVKDLPDEIGNFVRFSKPSTLMFSSSEYRQAIRRYYQQWPFDMVIIDPWSDVVRDEKFSDYQEGLENVLASLPGGEGRPAMVIVAHLKKSVLGEKRMMGRQLMGQVSGSMRLMQKARTAFMLQPASDDTSDDRVVFDCGKSNNDQPLPMSAWHRCNGNFLICSDFDFEEWSNPSEEKGKSITQEVMQELFNGGRRAAKKVLVEELKGKGYSQPTAYRALDLKLKFKDFLTEMDGLISWKG
jgi:replicative DNA helicase